MPKKQAKEDVGPIQTLLKQVGLKATPIRLETYSLFQGDSHESHVLFDIKSLTKALNKKKIKADEATVYRTLLSFEKVGFIKVVNNKTSTTFYEWAHGEHHHHIVCTNCGDTEVITDSRVEKVSHDIGERSKKFKIMTDHVFELFGICQKCFVR